MATDLPPDLLTELEPLREQLHSTRDGVLPVVGSGLSRGLPSWLHLLKELIAEVPAEDQDTLHAWLEKGKYLEIAGFLEHDSTPGRAGVLRRIQRHYQRPKSPAPPVYDTLVKLPVGHWLTTNYDPWLKNALARRLGEAPRVYVPTDAGAFSDINPGSPPWVLMAHGDADRPETCVLSEESYVRLSDGNLAWRRAMQGMLGQRHLLFVGHSLSDPDLGVLLDEWQAVFTPDGGAPRHWFLNTPISRPDRARLLRKGVQAVDYRDHALLPALLAWLATPPATVQISAPVYAPRVLLAGPWLGVPEGLRRDIEKVKTEIPDPTLQMRRIRAMLEGNPLVEACQVRAIVQHDVVVDLSPWGALRRWRSLGFSERPRSGPATIAVFAAGDSAPATPEDEQAALGRLLDAHRAQLMAGGLRIAGFGEAEAAVAQKIAELLGVTTDPRWSARWEPTADGTLAEYARAVRVVHGGVRLLGEETWHPIADVFVELSLHELPRPTPKVKIKEDKEDSEYTLREALTDEPPATDRVAPTVAPSALLGRGPRLDLVGLAGSGKTTLLRWLACHEVARPDAPLVLLVDAARMTVTDLHSAHLARLAAERVFLGESVRSALAAAIERGQATVLLDGHDEASEPIKEQLPPFLERLPAGVRVLLSTRPWRSALTGVWKAVALRGLDTFKSETFLAAYYPDAPWRGELVRAVRALPTWRVWLETPVLLALAAAVYQRSSRLPEATLELYDAAIDCMLEVTAKRMGADAGATPQVCQQARQQLSEFAYKKLAQTPVESVYHADEVARLGWVVRQSGLFIGGARPRWAHLTLGEFLAAKGALSADLQASPPGEVGPMLLALQGSPRVDTETLLLLRALAYGGPLWQRRAAWLERVQQGVMAALIDPSGAFGESEQRVVEAALRLAWEWPELSAKLRPQVVEVLERSRGPGESRGWVWCLALATGVEDLLRAPREPADVIGAALVRRGCSMEQIDAWVGGEESGEVRAAAVEALANDPEARTALRMRLDDADANVRVAAIEVLASDPETWPEIRARLDDPDATVRAAAVAALASDPETWPEIRARLDDSDADVRVAAVAALASDPETWPEIRARLDDPNATVRAAAVEALANDLEIRFKLRARLDDSDANVRVAAVHALASDPETWPTIRARLDDPDATVLAATIWALANDPNFRSEFRARLKALDVKILATAIWILTERIDDLSASMGRFDDSRADVRVAAVGALVNNPDVWSTLKARLDDPDAEVRVAVVWALFYAPETLPTLSKHLEDPASDVRVAVVWALARDPNAWSEVKKRLEDPNEDVRVAAVEALASDPNAWPEIRKRLEDPNEDVRAAAVEALASDPNARPEIRKRLEDSNGDVRAAAVQVLASDPNARSEIRTLLDNSNSEIRAAAVLALANDPDAWLTLRARLNDLNADVHFAALKTLANDSNVRPALRARLYAPNADVRVVAIHALASDPETRPEIRSRLDDLDADVRATAIEALASDPEARSAIRARLKDSSWIVRVTAIEALAGDPDAQSAIRARLKDSNWLVRSVAIETLETDPAVWPAIRERLGDSDTFVRASAIRSLARDSESWPAIHACLDDPNDSVRAAAVRSLASDPENWSVLLARFDDPYWPVRFAAVEALASDPAARPLLYARLDDSESYVRAAAVEALASDPAARPALRKRLADPEFNVYTAAIEALRAPHPPEVPLRNSLLSVSLSAVGVSVGLDAEHLALAKRLQDWVAHPRLLDPSAGALYGAARDWLLARLGLDGVFIQPKPLQVWGERQDRSTPEDQPCPVHLLRLYADARTVFELRGIAPTHNLIEAWARARYLRDPATPTFWLVCADVAWEDLEPPLLSPGQYHHAGVWYGFRLLPPGPEPTVPGVDPLLSLIASASPIARWQALSAAEQAQVRGALDQLGAQTDLDPWPFVRLIAALGAELGPAVRERWARQLPTGTGEIAASLAAAHAALGNNTPRMPTSEPTASPVSALATLLDALEAGAERWTELPSLLAMGQGTDFNRAFAAIRKRWKRDRTVDLARALRACVRAFPAHAPDEVRGEAAGLTSVFDQFLARHGDS